VRGQTHARCECERRGQPSLCAAGRDGRAQSKGRRHLQLRGGKKLMPQQEGRILGPGCLLWHLEALSVNPAGSCGRNLGRVIQEGAKPVVRRNTGRAAGAAMAGLRRPRSAQSPPLIKQCLSQPTAQNPARRRAVHNPSAARAVMPLLCPPACSIAAVLGTHGLRAPCFLSDTTTSRPLPYAHVAAVRPSRCVTSVLDSFLLSVGSGAAPLAACHPTCAPARWAVRSRAL
jgi:hypothetical protein